MKKVYECICKLFLIGIVILVCSLSCAEAQEGIIFYDKLDKSVDVGGKVYTQAKSFKTPDNVTGGLITGSSKIIDSSFGKALLFNGDCNLEYPAGGNINLSAGELSFNVALNFDPEEKNEKTRTILRNQMFFTAKGPGRVEVSVYSCLNDIRFALINDQGNIVSMLGAPVAWKQQENHSIRLSWGKEVSLWIDGKKLASTALNGLFGSVQVKENDLRLILGNMLRSGIESEFTMNELMIKEANSDNSAICSRISIPYISESPVLNGKLSDPFWQKTSRVTGFVKVDKNVLAEEQPIVYAAYNSKGIYFGLEATLANGRQSQAVLAQRDSAIYSEDAFEFRLQQNPNKSDYYLFMTSAIGTLFDAKMTRDPNNQRIQISDMGFTPDWEVKTSKETGRWTAEIFIPYSSINCEQPKPGDIWKGNLCIDSSVGIMNGSCWTYTAANNNNEKKFGEFLFTGSDRAMRQNKMEGFIEGEPKLTQLLLGGFAPVVNIKSEVYDSSGNKIYNYQTPLRDYNSVEIKPGILTTGSYTFVVSAVEPDGRSVFYQTFGFTTAKALSLTAQNYPYAGFALVKADIRGLKGAANKVVISLLSKDKKSINKTELVKFQNGMGEVKFDTNKLAPGTYQINAEACSADGKVLESAKQEFSIFSKPVWWKNNVGMDHSVPAPFEAVKVNKNGLSIWGREYIYDKKVLPKQIINQKKAMFAGDCTLSIKADGVILDAGKLSSEKSEVFPDIVSFYGSKKIGNLTVSCKSEMEFDGCMRLDLMLNPSKPVNLEDISLSIPMDSSIAKFILSSNGASSSSSFLDKDYKNNFIPYVWVGNDYQGLAVFFESDQYWSYNDKTAIEIKFDEKQALLKFNMVNKPYILDKQAKISIGFMASPVRPIPTDPFAFIHHASPPDKMVFPEKLEYQILEGLLPDAGTIEFLCKKSTLQNNGNTELFHLKGNGKSLGCYLLTPGEPNTLAIYNGNERLISCQVPLSEDSFSHIAFTWNNGKLGLFVNGKLAGSASSDLVKDIVKTGKSSLVFGCNNDTYGFTGIVIDEIRASNSNRYNDSFEVSKTPFVTDDKTVILDHLEDNFRPDGEDAQTKAGGVPSIGCAFVDGKFGNALKIEVASPISGDQLIKQNKTNLIQDWAIQSWDKYGWPPVLFAETVPGIKEKNAHLNSLGVNVIPYMAYPAIGAPSPLKDQFGDEWCTQPVSTLPYPPPADHYMLTTCLKAKGYADYYAAGTAWLMDKLGFDGDYTDGAPSVYTCQNQAHGCGYIGADGNLHPTWPFFEVRDGVKRMYKTIKSKNPNGIMVNHSSFNLILPTLSFSDTIYTGEHEDYENPMTIRLRFTGRPWGIYINILGSSEHEYSSVHAMAGLLNGTTVLTLGCGGRKDNLRKDANIRKAYNDFLTSTAKWVPFYEGEGILYKCSDPKVFVSTYYHSGKDAFMVIANFNKEKVTSDIKINLSNLGIQGKSISAENALTGEAITASNDGTISPTITGKSFVLLRLNTTK